ncbi:MAG: DUF1624 domain-containing protein [Beijerinckiaceae bacterium]|nr:DUF1624 domain-containing protein [Beijerinckiaceae bacterium]MDO9441349.1 heparan-alpha-glucosaminide N-acetyltransferase [Beijerinckiaceae bacterium]
MSDPSPSRLAFPRTESLDAARGWALVAMFVFHIVWDLGFFALVPLDWPTDPRFKAFGHAIATAFVGLAGVGLTLGARNGVLWGPALKRVARIALAAAAVSAATYAIFPDEFIFFGILHVIALASLCALPLLRAPSLLVGGVAAVALALPLLVSEPLFDHPAFWWLGLGTDDPRSNDWRPFLPWFGVMLAGVLVGRLILARGLPDFMANWRARSGFGRSLVWGGRHSLLVYLVHQPVFIAVIFVAAKMVGPRPPPSGHQFVQTCEAQCVTSGGQAGFCKRVCGCIVEQSQAQNLWRAVSADRLTPEERKRFDELTRTCARFETGGGLY